MKDIEKTQMSRRRRPRWCAVLLFAPVVAVLVGGGAAGEAQDGATTQRFRDLDDGVILGQTKPSKEMDLAFADLGVISELHVKEGDQVEAGQMLIQQDAAADMAALAALEAEADVGARVKLAETQLALAEVELEALRFMGHTAQPLEVKRAELQVQAEETRILEERRSGKVAQHRADQQRARIEQRSIKSPESGVVRKIDSTPGEVSGPQTPALQVVKIDPLYVEVANAPAAQVMGLRVGDPIKVRYVGADEWQDATIVFVDPVGDPFGEPARLSFRAELPNPDKRPAGLPMQVQMPSGQPQARAENGPGSPD